MKKIIVIGSPGAGKSCFSRELSEITGIPLYHLDMLFWNPDATHVDQNTFVMRQKDIMSDDCWIIDGNYSSTVEFRLEQCDTVFYLDIPLERCLEGAVSRRGKKRDDLPWIESVEMDEEFREYIMNFHSHGRPELMEMLGKHSNKNIHIFTSRDDACSFLNNLSKKV